MTETGSRGTDDPECEAVASREEVQCTCQFRGDNLEKVTFMLRERYSRFVLLGSEKETSSAHSKAELAWLRCRDYLLLLSSRRLTELAMFLFTSTIALLFLFSLYATKNTRSYSIIKSSSASGG